MARRQLSMDNWVIPDRNGTLHRFTTYGEAAKAKRTRPTEFSTSADIKFARPE